MKKTFWAIIIATVGLLGAPTVPVSATESSSESRCHLDGKKGILVDYSGTRIFAPYGPQEYSKSVGIPSGVYDVYLEAYDGHEGRTSENQKQEQYTVSFVAGTKTIAKTSPSGDVPDDVSDAFWQGRVDSSFTIDRDVSKVNIVHAAAGKQGKTNSVSPTCMLLVAKEIKKPVHAVCGNGKREAQEQCDDGNKIPGDGCSSVCSLERTINDPVCGNNIVESGEQCDDGNANEAHCTQQCVHPEQEEDDDKCDGEIGNTVFHDRNANGVHDEGEEGITGVKVKLQYGDKVRTDTTNFRGRYKFEDRCQDTYRVIVATETLGEGCYQTYDKDGKLDHTHKVELDDGEEYTKADFGYKCSNRISPATGAGSLAGGAAAAFAAGAAWLAHRRMREDAGTIIPMV